MEYKIFHSFVHGDAEAYKLAHQDTISKKMLPILLEIMLNPLLKKTKISSKQKWLLSVPSKCNFSSYSKGGKGPWKDDQKDIEKDGIDWRMVIICLATTPFMLSLWREHTECSTFNKRWRCLGTSTMKPLMNDGIPCLLDWLIETLSC